MESRRQYTALCVITNTQAPQIERERLEADPTQTKQEPQLSCTLVQLKNEIENLVKLGHQDFASLLRVVIGIGGP